MALRSRLPALARALEPQTLGSWMGLRCTTHRAAAALSTPASGAGTRRAGLHAAAGPARAAAADEQQQQKAATAEAGEQQAAQQQSESSGDEAAPQLTLEECTRALNDATAALEEEKKKAEDMKDRLLRTLADMENLRERTARTTAEAKTFAVQGLVKNLLDVADNLERAAGAVAPESITPDSEVDRDRALAMLRSLRDGVLMTDAVLMKVLAKEGVTRYDALGQPFDPNLHDALFEVPDATKEPGTCAVVIKRGYMLNERVVRAAEVGVARAVDE